MSTVGHNSVAADELRQFIERWEHLDQEKKEIAEHQKDVMAEAKGRGYDTKIIRKLIAERKRKASEVAEEAAILELYREAIKMPAPRVVPGDTQE